MNNTDIQKLIESENEDRRDEMLRRARKIITEIGKYQEGIVHANNHIAELRADLKALEAQQLTSAEVTGE